MKEKRILIVSDTHTRPERLYDCIDQDGPFDLMLHMGDMTGSEDYIKEIMGCPIQAVRGNCDYRSDWPVETLIEAGDHLIFMTHGHMYSVNFGLEELEAAARDYGADIAMYGHTHVPYYEELEDGMIILNPGSLGNPRQTPRIPTYMVMTVNEETGEIRFTSGSIGGEGQKKSETNGPGDLKGLFQELFKDFRKK